MEYLQPGHGDILPPPPLVHFKSPKRRWMTGQEAKFFTPEDKRNPDDLLLSHKHLSTILLP